MPKARTDPWGPLLSAISPRREGSFLTGTLGSSRVYTSSFDRRKKSAIFPVLLHSLKNPPAIGLIFIYNNWYNYMVYHLVSRIWFVIISRKAALSLLISILLFAGFTVLSFTGIFNLIEARFYNPSITRALTLEANSDAETIDEYIDTLQNRFAATLTNDAVQQSFLPTQSAGGIAERSQLYGTLLESLGGLQSVRFIDSGGSRIHYSSYASDILRQDQQSIAYRNYADCAGYIPYATVEVPNQGSPRILMEEAGERILFSYPFYDSFEVYRGTALFSLSVRAITERLVGAGRIKVGEDVSVIAEPRGIVSGLPRAGRNALLSLIASVWGDGILSPSALNSTVTETHLTLISAKTGQGIYIGRLVDESLLVFPQAMKIIILISFLLTVYLIIFLLFNLRQDTITIIQSRLKRLQVNLIEEYYEHKGDVDWKQELEQRREDVRAELKRGIKIKPGTANSENIDTFIDKSWDELVMAIGGRVERRGGAGIDEEKLRSILTRILQTTQGAVLPSALPSVLPSALPIARSTVRPAAKEIPARSRLRPPPDKAVEKTEVLEELGNAPGKELKETLLDISKKTRPADIGEETVPPEASDTSSDTFLGELEEVSLEDLDAMPGELLEELEEVPENPDAMSDELLEELEEVPPESPDAMSGELLEELEEVTPESPDAMSGELLEELEEVTPESPDAMSDELLEELEEVPPENPDAVPGELLVVESEFTQLDPSVLNDWDGLPRDTSIEVLTSKIEFSPLPEELERATEEAAQSMGQSFEVVSPFSTILSDFSNRDTTEELFIAAGIPQPQNLFQTTKNGTIETLEALPGGKTTGEYEIPDEAQDGISATAPEANAAEASSIIVERDGVNYINEDTLAPKKKPGQNLDRNFKNLVNSVLHKK
jgi:hypothetical protein